MAMRTLLSFLQQAMLSERDGASFYSMAAEHAEDAGAKDMFERLADEERRHFNALQKEYQSVLDTGRWNPNVAWDSPWMPEDASPLFSADFTRRIRGQHIEMAALSIGLLLEKQSFEFYTTQAHRAEDAGVKAFFQALASWENGHYQMLLKEDEALKEAYWSENRFEPLL